MTERFADFTKEKVRDLKFHLSLLEDQSRTFGLAEDPESQNSCVREIQSLATALVKSFRLEYERVVNYAVYTAPARKDELKKALLGD